MVSATFGLLCRAATLADFGTVAITTRAVGPESDRNDAGAAVEANVRHPGWLGAVEQVLRVRLGQNLGNLFLGHDGDPFVHECSRQKSGAATCFSTSTVTLNFSPRCGHSRRAPICRELAERGIGLVYGAGGHGLMRDVSQGALDAGGEVIGVIPRSMIEREWGRIDLPDVHVVNTMHERKARMADAGTQTDEESAAATAAAARTVASHRSITAIDHRDQVSSASQRLVAPARVHASAEHDSISGLRAAPEWWLSRLSASVSA